MKNNVRKSPFSGKKVLCYKKTGITKAKKYKNRIYLRKKSDDKNRKKKDFFPPYRYTAVKQPSLESIQLSHMPPPNTRGAYFESLVGG